MTFWQYHIDKLAHNKQWANFVYVETGGKIIPQLAKELFNLETTRTGRKASLVNE